MATGNAIDPIHQFIVAPLAQIRIGGIDASFTNASLFMVIVLLAATFLMIIGTAQKAIVPGRLQSAAEMAYEFVASTVRGTTGTEGMKFFPLVFSLFMFVLLSNLIGLIPYTFTVTSQIVVTFALAALVILTVIIYGLINHGTHFLHLFVPSGVAPALLPFIVLIEVISFVSRPISLSVRLFANMLAGHILLVTFALLSEALFQAKTNQPFLNIMGVLPFFMLLFLTAFEVLVAFLQAYIFTILTAVYIGGAMHPEH